jgi:hypothetical protein
MRSEFGGPYAFCATGCAWHVLDWISLHSTIPDSQLACWVEQGHRELPNLLRLWGKFFASPSLGGRITTVAAVSKAALPGHTADLLTHERTSHYPKVGGPVMDLLHATGTLAIRDIDSLTLHKFSTAMGGALGWPRLGYQRGRRVTLRW